MLPRIYVDFNTMMTDSEGRVFLDRVGLEHIEHRSFLQPGSLVTLFDEEFEVQATVEYVVFSDDYQAWLGRPNWTTKSDCV